LWNPECQQSIRPEEEPKEEVAGDKIILNAMKGLEMATQFMCQFAIENLIVIMCNELENELQDPHGES
jgi:hypothetical protein